MQLAVRPILYAVLLNTLIALLLFMAVKSWVRPPLEEALSVAILLVPTALHFLLWPSLRFGVKLGISAVSLTLSIVGMFAVALALFGDAL